MGSLFLCVWCKIFILCWAHLILFVWDCSYFQGRILAQHLGNFLSHRYVSVIALKYWISLDSFIVWTPSHIPCSTRLYKYHKTCGEDDANSLPANEIYHVYVNVHLFGIATGTMYVAHGLWGFARHLVFKVMGFDMRGEHLVTPRYTQKIESSDHSFQHSSCRLCD